MSIKMIGGDGVLYGATRDGGSAGDGTVFALAPPIDQGQRGTVRNIT
jgi:uncharacterized repeat protein (TIGR03803 family)